MTIKTITFDDTTHKIVPLEPTEYMLEMAKRLQDWPQTIKSAIEAAPEYEGLRSPHDITGLMHELWAIAQSKGPVSDTVDLMVEAWQKKFTG